MSYKKLETDIYQFIDKLNELRGFIQINSERNTNFINYLKTNECREKKLKMYLTGSICDLKGINEIEYNQYSSVELLKVLHTLIEIGSILEEIEPIHYCEMLKITLKTIKMMTAVHYCEKFHEAIEYFIRSFKIPEKLQKGIQNKDEPLLKLVNFHMKIISHGLLRLFDGSNFIGIRSLIADFVEVELIYFKLTDFDSKTTIDNYRKEFRYFFWELLENPTFFQELQIYLLNILDDHHMLVFYRVCVEIVEQVIISNKKSIYDSCLPSMESNLFKIMINALTKCSPNNYLNNYVNVKIYTWILSRLMLLNYHDTSKFEYMEHIIVCGVFSENYLICILSMDIWLLVAHELHAAEKINYVHICENLNQASYNYFNLSKSLLKIININIYNTLDSDSQTKLKKHNCLQFYSLNGMVVTFNSVLLNQSTKNNYYELIQIIQSLEFHNSSYQQYEEILNMLIDGTANIDCRKFHKIIMCILNNIKNPKDLILLSQLLNKFKLPLVVNKNKISSVMKLLCLIDLFHEKTMGTKTSVKKKIELLLDDKELLVRLIAYKSLELSKVSTIITKNKFTECYTQHILYVSNIQIKDFHQCVKYRYTCNNIEERNCKDTQIGNALHNVLRFSKILQDIPNNRLTTQHKIKIVKISENLNLLNVFSKI